MSNCLSVLTILATCIFQLVLLLLYVNKKPNGMDIYIIQATKEIFVIQEALTFLRTCSFSSLIRPSMYTFYMMCLFVVEFAGYKKER
jgi:hypothetical protein